MVGRRKENARTQCDLNKGSIDCQPMGIDTTTNEDVMSAQFPISFLSMGDGQPSK